MTMQRIALGIVLLLAGMAIGISLDTLDWAWPWNVLATCALALPGTAFIEPPLERRVSRWLGRTQ